MIMRVEFNKGGEGRLCGWVAAPPKGRAFEGSTIAAGRDVPHDLTQIVIERALDIRDGFRGLLAHGGSFASVPGRAGIMLPGCAASSRRLIWVVVGFLVIGAVLNALTPSAWERAIWLPVTLALLTCAVVIARGP